MTKKILTFAFLGAFLIFISASASFAQSVEQQVAKIRQLYAATNKQIDAGLEDNTQGLHYAAWTIGGERDGQQWSGVGTMHSTDEFYFDCEPIRMEECGAKDVKKLIRKIVSTYKGASDMHTRSEYLFDEKGEFVFAYTSELADVGEDNVQVRKTVEQRFYFAKGKLIRLAREGKNTDARFTAEDLQKSKDALAEANRLRNIFAVAFAE